PGRPQIRQQGEHDSRVDRQNHQYDDGGQEIRTVPLVLVEFRSVGQSDGVRRGGDPVDVVAGGDRRQGARHPVRVPALAGRLPGLGLHAGADEASRRPQARLLLRIHELVHLGFPGRVHLPPWLVSWLQVCPLAFVLVVLFALPTLLFVVVSFWDYDRTGIYPAFVLDNYRDLLTTPATIRVYLSSLVFAVIAWAITLFLGFNIAHFLIFHVRNAAVRTLLFLLCAIPFWTSGIIRTIAWIPFLGRNGAFNQIVMALA